MGAESGRGGTRPSLIPMRGGGAEDHRQLGLGEGPETSQPSPGRFPEPVHLCTLLCLQAGRKEVTPVLSTHAAEVLGPLDKHTL